jgi:hypothetical protein
LLEIPLVETNLPRNYIVLSETETHFKVINVSEFLKLTCALELTPPEWDTLIKHCVVFNTLDQLRNMITQSRNVELENAKVKAKQGFKFNYIPQRDALIATMTDAFMNSESERQRDLKCKLDLIRDLTRQEDAEWMRFQKSFVDQVRKKWDTIRNLLSAFNPKNDDGISGGSSSGSSGSSGGSTSVFSLNNFVFSSNRANRAKYISEDELMKDINEVSLTTTDEEMKGVPEISCAICLEQGPFVLWLQKYEDLEYSTSDFCINFPLSQHAKLQKMLISNPVCGFCANSYLNYKRTGTATSQCVSVYRETLHGDLKSNWKLKQNSKFNYGMLCKIMCGNKTLHHVRLFLLSVLDDCDAKWLTEECRGYLKRQLIENVVTNDSFSEECKKNEVS